MTAKKPATPAKTAKKRPIAQKTGKKGAPKSLEPKKTAPAPAPRPLNNQQALFVSEYLKDRNATQAATRAGYSAKSAEWLGYQLLQNPLVRAAVDAGMEKLLNDNGLTANRVLKELGRVAFFDPAKLYDRKTGRLLSVVDMDEDTRAAIASVEIVGTRTSKAGETAKVRMSDKTAALRMAAMHHGLLKEHVEVSGPGGGPIEVRELSDAERAVRLAALIATAQARAKKK
jgi:phage terminase small subunit